MRKHFVQDKKVELERRLQALDESQEKVEQLLEAEQLDAEVKEAADFRAKVSAPNESFKRTKSAGLKIFIAARWRRRFCCPAN